MKRETVIHQNSLQDYQIQSQILLEPFLLVEPPNGTQHEGHVILV